MADWLIRTDRYKEEPARHDGMARRVHVALHESDDRHSKDSQTLDEHLSTGGF